jgi:hypothetical protein
VLAPSHPDMFEAIRFDAEDILRDERMLVA